MDKMIDYALKYAEKGFAVFPIKPKGKTPITPHGCKDATTDRKQIEEWWAKEPSANIGIATGTISNNVYVLDIDVDSRKGIDGMDNLCIWESNNGELPDAPTVITGRGGYHFYYRLSGPMKNRAGILDGIDFRGVGGYVIAPPSIHPNGNNYKWKYDLDELPIAEANTSLLDLLSLDRKKADASKPLNLSAELPEGKRNDGLFRIASTYQARNYSDDEIRALLHHKNQTLCIPPLDDAEVDGIYNSVIERYKKGTEIANPFESLDDDEIVSPSELLLYLMVDKKNHAPDPYYARENISLILRHDQNLSPLIRYNELAQAIYVCGQLKWDNKWNEREWNDKDDIKLVSYFDKQYKIKSKEKILDELVIYADDKKYHPVVDYFENLNEWDGKDYISILLPKYLGASDSELNTEILKLFLLGAISRAYDPGCKFDYVPILVGEQGIGKSTFIRKLAINPSWYSDKFLAFDDKDAMGNLRGKWIIELGELSALKKTKDAEQFKAFITSQYDDYRTPYGKYTNRHKRQCVFFGTTNQSTFLSDPTGNRRFMPILIGTNPNRKKWEHRIFNDAEALEKDIQGAWTQALYIYRTEHPTLTLPPHLERAMQEIRDSYNDDDYRVGIIEEYLKANPGRPICCKEVWERALRSSREMSKKDSREIGDIMRNIKGCERIEKKVRCDFYGSQRAYEFTPLPDTLEHPQAPHDHSFYEYNDAPDL